MENYKIAIMISIVVLTIFYGLYVRLIRRKNTVKNALAGIDVQLMKRVQLIPEILTVAKRYMTHEKKMLEDITRLRSEVDGLKNEAKAEAVKKKFDAANELGVKMNRLFALAENYPDLKANKPLEKAMDIYHDTEENIAAARRFYNAAVERFNNACEIFPSSFVALLMRLKEYPFFEAPKGAEKPIKAADYL